MNGEEWDLTLYVAGRTVRSVRAIRNVRRLFPEFDEITARLEVIDVLEDPDKAEQAGIVATPTLIRHVPPPERRVIGDLSDADRLAEVLDLPELSPEIH